MSVWKRSEEQLEQRPCLGAPKCPAKAFQCRPDWRLNLVLSAGNLGSNNALPIFHSSNQLEFDALVARCMERTLALAGKVGQSGAELPYTLYRYRDDAPIDARNPTDTTEMRWSRALFPQDDYLVLRKISYCTKYNWTMYPELHAL